MWGLYSLVLGLFLAVSTSTSWAQCGLPQGGISIVRMDAPNFGEVPDPETTELPPAPDTQTQSTDKTTSQKTAAVADGNWHLIVYHFLLFPGVHDSLVLL